MKVFSYSLQKLTVRSPSLTPIPTAILFWFTFGDLNLLHSDLLLHQLEGIFFHHIAKAYQCFWLRKYLLLISLLTWSLKTILNLANSHLPSPIDLPLQRQIYGSRKNYLNSYFSFKFFLVLWDYFWLSLLLRLYHRKHKMQLLKRILYVYV